MDGVQTLTVADLLRLSRPLTGAASLRLFSSSPRPPKRPKLDQALFGDRTQTSLPCSGQDASPRSFLPIGRPVLLIGTVDLFPEDSELSPGCRNHCLSFSDDGSSTSSSSRICCSVLDFDLRIIGRMIHVLAWNFVPLKQASGGVLEVIQWNFLEMGSALIRYASLSIPSVHSSSRGNNSNFRALGVLKAVSLIFNVPHSGKVESHQKASQGKPVNAGESVGFLAEMLVCTCRHCSCLSSTCDLGEQDNHSFTESTFVYFIKPASIWRPVLFQLIGKKILVLGLKKKLVLVRRDKSYSTFVSTLETVVLLCPLPSNAVGSVTRSVKSGAEMYSGVVTAVYMHGMAVELDEKVWLLITDLELAPPHSLRVGALVSVTNFHLVRPRYTWTKMVLLGTCPRTCITMKSFALSETRCHLKSRTRSLLGKFIESLTFSARFWALLLISCFKKKFTCFFSDKEILGSTNKEGLAQLYAARYLPSSAIQSRHGLFMEFCEHELCDHKSESCLASLKLVIPIFDLVSRCEAIFCSMLSPISKDAEIIGRNHFLRSLICKGSSYSRVISRTISSDELGFILMGKLKVSPHSGRLQFIDATGTIDVFIPDILISGIDEQNVYEVKNFKIVVEGLPKQLDGLQNCPCVQFSCKDIFQQLFSRRTLNKFAVYVHFSMKDLTCIDVQSRGVTCMIRNENPDRVRGEMFHLLLITHKFPAKKSFDEDPKMSSSSSLFAEALVLPYNLLFPERYQCNNSAETSVSKLDSEFYCISYLKDSRSHTQPGFILVSSETQLASSLNNLEEFDQTFIPCLLTSKCSNSHFQLPGCLYTQVKADSLDCHLKSHLSDSNLEESSEESGNVDGKAYKEMFNNQTDLRILLEFTSESFSKYQLLYIGSYYALRCSTGLDCSLRNCEQLMSGKALIHSQTTLWSLSFFGKTMHHGGPSEYQDSSSPLEVKKSSAASFCLNEVFIQFLNTNQQRLDVHPHLSAETIRPIKEEPAPVQHGLVGIPTLPDAVISVSSCIQLMMLELVRPSGLADLPVSNLPQGCQISIKGNVEDIHIYGGKSKSYFSVYEASHNYRIQKICIHVSDHDDMVLIRGSLRKNACPVGLGPGANATFFRILMTRNSSRWHELVLTPMSFVVINSIKEPAVLQNKESPIKDLAENHPTGRFGGVPMSSISLMMEYMDTKLIQHQCRVVNVLVLVLEKYAHSSQELQSRTSSIPIANISLAGFVLDDGSSLCCYWASSGQAESFLRLREVAQRAFLSGRKKLKEGSGHVKHSVGYYLMKMLKKHRRVTIQNCGVEPDFPCIDLTFSFGSDKNFTAAEERLLNFIVLHACHGPLIRVVGNTMDSNTLKYIKMKFPESSHAMESMKHLWVREVEYLDALKEAGNMLNALVF